MNRCTHILVVDDNPLLRLLLSECLTVANCNIVEAGSADEAMELLEADEAFDLVMTDVEMPGSMNGIALANVIHGRWPDIALIVTSGCVRPTAEMLPARAEFIRKPSRPQDVVRVVQSLIQNRIDSLVTSDRVTLPPIALIPPSLASEATVVAPATPA